MSLSVFYQLKDGYGYNSDTLILYDFVKQIALKPNSSVLEIGCGCGIIGILLARDFDISLTQIEIQKVFYELSCKNAKCNNIDSQILNKNFLNHSFTTKFDYIISNPPYYDKGVLKSENKHFNICKMNEYLPIKDFFKKTKSILSNKGIFIFCYDAKQTQYIMSELTLCKLNVVSLQFIYSKQDKPARLALFYCKVNSKSALMIKPSLTISNEQEIQKIYDKSKTYTIKY